MSEYNVPDLDMSDTDPMSMLELRQRLHNVKQHHQLIQKTIHNGERSFSLLGYGCYHARYHRGIRYATPRRDATDKDLDFLTNLLNIRGLPREQFRHSLSSFFGEIRMYAATADREIQTAELAMSVDDTATMHEATERAAYAADRMLYIGRYTMRMIAKARRLGGWVNWIVLRERLGLPMSEDIRMELFSHFLAGTPAGRLRMDAFGENELEAGNAIARDLLGRRA